MKRYIKCFVLFLMSLPTVNCDITLVWTREGKPLSSDEKELIKNGSLEKERKFVLTSFFKVNKRNIENKLSKGLCKLEDLEKLCSDRWHRNVEHFLFDDEEEIFFVSAKDEEEIIGLAMFTKTRNESEVYISQFVIIYDYLENGMAQKLVFSILDKIPTLKKIRVKRMKPNSNVIEFLKELGFKEFSYSDEESVARCNGLEYVVS